MNSKEISIVSTRDRICNETLRNICNTNDENALPRVAVCFSGGGWRAMTSGVAFLDALATPMSDLGLPQDLMPSHNPQGTKVLDAFSHAFGLSGGSWLLFTSLVGGEQNPFHTPPEQSSSSPNPWLAGGQHRFNTSQHRYVGLQHMVQSKTVDAACHRGGKSTALAKFMRRATADTTIGVVLTCPRLGDSLGQRWAGFIANDILNFVDAKRGQGELTHKDDVGGDADDDEEGGSWLSGITDKILKRKQIGLEKKKKMDALRTVDQQRASRHINFGSTKSLIESGKFPFVVCAAIANCNDNISEDELAHTQNDKDHKLYDWVEFTPFFSQNRARNLTITTDQLRGAPDKGKVRMTENQANEMGIPQNQREDDTHVEGYCLVPSNLVRDPVQVHDLMSVCGSAFACDATAVLPGSVSRGISDHYQLKSTPLLGRGTTVLYGPNSEQFGVCRDAGIDFNVPFPPMLARQCFDVCLVMDAGGGSTKAFELKRAVDLGYLTLTPDSPDPNVEFGSECVKVFRSTNGTTIVYALGLTERGTHQIVQSPDDVIKDVNRARTRVQQRVIPVLLNEIKAAHARKMGTTYDPAAVPKRNKIMSSDCCLVA